MLETGLTLHEARIISIVAPCVALFGPLIVGPLADALAARAAGNTKNKFGKYIRIMIATTLVLAALFYLLLLSVPTAVRLKSRRPHVSFTSDSAGGIVLQERCTEERRCHQWTDAGKTGQLQLSNCRYICHTTPSAHRRNASDTTLGYPEVLLEADASAEEDGRSEYDNYEADSTDAELAELNANYTYDENESDKKRRQTSPDLLEPPHLCYNNSLGTIVCEVYTEDTKNMSIDVSLENIEDDDDEWCKYKLKGYFNGRISESIARSLHDPSSNSCRPVIQCNVEHPYAHGSVLAESQCIKTIGDPEYTFWSYLIIRSIADIFPTAAIVLFDAAIIIATRETSSGRGDVGRQLAWGTVGFAIFAPIAGYLSQDVMPASSAHAIAIIMFAAFMILAALITLFSSGMPLSPPEWWWHTKCGMLALPMSSVKHYKFETGVLVFVLFLLGIFWSTLDSYLPWHLTKLYGSPVLIGLTITMGALPAIPFLWYAEKIVDYCGHTNLLITAFTFYIIRYTGTGMISEPWWVLVSESMEVFTLILMWVTAVFYLRHLIPRKYTVTGQALPVIAHFCLGRCIGAIFGGLAASEADLNHEPLNYIYPYMAIAAAVIATIYFVVYHIFIRPSCVSVTNGPPKSPPTVMQSMNGNGSYTPLRIYHNGRARKGQFRY